MDLLSGLRILRNERRDRLEETEKLSKELGWLQKHLPAANGLAYGIEKATQCALDLNTTFAHIRGAGRGTGTAPQSGQWIIGIGQPQ